MNFLINRKSENYVKIAVIYQNANKMSNWKMFDWGLNERKS